MTRDEMEFAQEQAQLVTWYEQTEVPRLLEVYEVDTDNLKMQIDSLSSRVDALLTQRKLLLAGIIVGSLAGLFVGLSCGS